MENALSIAFEDGIIQPEQYSAVLIDEGHDFNPEWLRILTRMADTKNNTLLFLYDDAQSIYQKRKRSTSPYPASALKLRGERLCADAGPLCRCRRAGRRRRSV